jgi:hypothetical protein
MEPIDAMQHILYKLVMQKNFTHGGTMQPNQQSKFNNYTNRWEYYCPCMKTST